MLSRHHETPLRLGPSHAAVPLLAGVLGISFAILPDEPPPGVYRGYSPLLPVVSSAPPVQESLHDSYVMVSDEGLVFFHSKWVPPAELPAMFQAVAQQTLAHPGSRVFLKMDRSTPFGTVRYLLQSLRDIGIGEATFLVESRGPAPLRPGA